MANNPLRNLPSVHEILQTVSLSEAAGAHPHDHIVAAIRAELATIRSQFQEANDALKVPDVATIAAAAVKRLWTVSRPILRPVINATGIVLHTNLGRAPMANVAAEAARSAARGYLNLELDLQTGKRSSRQLTVREGLSRLTGAESATAVNNNAAATVVALRALCRRKEVILSRGQLIEIGGSFRIPEIMSVSGALLREVGTTNITRLADYERAIGPETGAIMRVHSSNYRVRGFTRTVALADLVALGRKHHLPVIDDVGSGALIDFARFGFDGEPMVQSSVATGADLVLFSGDKLLGGPQAGLIVGRKIRIQKIEKDPLMRAFRLDKMVLAALEATLRLYLHGEQALTDIPILRLLATPLEELQRRAEAVAAELRKISGIATVTVKESASCIGGGSLPDQTMPSRVVELGAAAVNEAEFAQRLRMGTPAVVGRLRTGKVLFDLRTVFPHQDVELVEATRRALDVSLLSADSEAEGS
jgi:L-seryl-tRNA(Ser) seleniumtransferase